MFTTTSFEYIYPEMVSWRRHLHQHPELSFQEYETTRYVYDLLNQWGIQARIGKTGVGVIATIQGKRPGPTVALRADLDALPIQDEKNTAYASHVAGKMHACGHDAHTATLLGTAKILQQNSDALTGNVRLIFQHAEEICPGGALDMIADGALEGVDVIYGIHLWTPLPSGVFASLPGPFMAAADEFKINIIGKGGHGGMPHETIDSIVIGAQLVTNLQTIVSRTVNPLHTCVVSVGSFHAGESFNCIADQSILTGTVRTFDETVRAAVKQRVIEMTDRTAAIYGADADIQYEYGYPPVVNDETEAARFFRVAAPLCHDHQPRHLAGTMAAEDFAYYLQKVPGCYMFVGAGQINEETSWSHHHPKFDLDESAMLQAVKLFLSMVADYTRSS